MTMKIFCFHQTLEYTFIFYKPFDVKFFIIGNLRYGTNKFEFEYLLILTEFYFAVFNLLKQIIQKVIDTAIISGFSSTILYPKSEILEKNFMKFFLNPG